MRSAMKITEVKVRSVSLGPLERPFWNSIVKTMSRGFSRTEVYTDEGIVGMAPGGGGVLKGFIEGAIQNKLKGMDPTRVGHIWDTMYMGGTRKPVARGDYIVAMSAVDNAIWDLNGKTLGLPVWKLAGGAQQTVRAYAAGGYYEDEKGLAELEAEMISYVKQGFESVKMKVGWPGAGLRHDAERVAAVRKAVGPDIDLMVDANNAWDAPTAIQFGRMIGSYGAYWFEEPVRADDIRGALKVRQTLDLPVASGENEYTRWGFRELIEGGGADIIQADPNTCGGITEWLRIAAIASAHHLPMAPHGNPQIGSTCVAAVENGLITENYPTAFKNDFLAPVDFKDGQIFLSDEPGLGLEWNEKLIESS